MQSTLQYRNKRRSRRRLLRALQNKIVQMPRTLILDGWWLNLPAKPPERVWGQ
jgi:hypothetical protein